MKLENPRNAAILQSFTKERYAIHRFKVVSMRNDMTRAMAQSTLLRRHRSGSQLFWARSYWMVTVTVVWA